MFVQFGICWVNLEAFSMIFSADEVSSWPRRRWLSRSDEVAVSSKNRLCRPILGSWSYTTTNEKPSYLFLTINCLTCTQRTVKLTRAANQPGFTMLHVPLLRWAGNERVQLRAPQYTSSVIEYTCQLLSASLLESPWELLSGSLAERDQDHQKKATA